MGYSKHELGTIDMLYSLKKIVILRNYLSIMAISPQWPLSSVLKAADVERFNYKMLLSTCKWSFFNN